MSTDVAVVQPVSLVQKFASRYSVDSDKLLTTLKATAFKQRDNTVISNEQMMALLVVADQYKLNPFTKEIYAFPDKSGIVPVVSVDGWARIINEHPQFNGAEFAYSEKTMDSPDGTTHKVFEWVECKLYRKDRDHATVIREYLDEVFRMPIVKKGDRGTYEIPTPWQTHPKRMHRHKTLIQCARIAFGFAGIYDDDEARRIMESGEPIDMGQAVVVEQPKAKPKAAAQVPAKETSGGASNTPKDPASAAQKTASPPPSQSSAPSAASAGDAVPSSAPQDDTAVRHADHSPERCKSAEDCLTPARAEPIEGELLPRENAPTLSDCLALADKACETKGGLAAIMPTLQEYRKALSAEDQATLDSTLKALMADQQDAPGAPAGPPLSAGQRRILTARLKSNGKDMAEFEKKFGPMDQCPASNWDAAQAWASA